MDERLAEYVADRWRGLVGYATVVCGDPSEAEDIVQTVLVKVAARWPLVRHRDDLDRYVRTAIVRTQISRWRRHKVAADAPLPARVQAGDEADATETAMVVMDALRQLPPRQRAVLVLRYLSDLSVEDTAAVMRCSAGTVKSQTSKALAALRRDFPSLRETAEEARHSADPTDASREVTR